MAAKKKNPSEVAAEKALEKAKAKADKAGKVKAKPQAKSKPKPKSKSKSKSKSKAKAKAKSKSTAETKAGGEAKASSAAKSKAKAKAAPKGNSKGKAKAKSRSLTAQERKSMAAILTASSKAELTAYMWKAQEVHEGLKEEIHSKSSKSEIVEGLLKAYGLGRYPGEPDIKVADLKPGGDDGGGEEDQDGTVDDAGAGGDDQEDGSDEEDSDEEASDSDGDGDGARDLLANEDDSSGSEESGSESGSDGYGASDEDSDDAAAEADLEAEEKKLTKKLKALQAKKAKLVAAAKSTKKAGTSKIAKKSKNDSSSSAAKKRKKKKKSASGLDKNDLMQVVVDGQTGGRERLRGMQFLRESLGRYLSLSKPHKRLVIKITSKAKWILKGVQNAMVDVPASVLRRVRDVLEAFEKNREYRSSIGRVRTAIGKATTSWKAMSKSSRVTSEPSQQEITIWVVMALTMHFAMEESKHRQYYVHIEDITRLSLSLLEEKIDDARMSDLALQSLGEKVKEIKSGDDPLPVDLASLFPGRGPRPATAPEPQHSRAPRPAPTYTGPGRRDTRHCGLCGSKEHWQSRCPKKQKAAVALDGTSAGKAGGAGKKTS